METERIILRKFTIDDASDVYSWAKNPNVGPRAGWTPHKDIEESKTIIEKVYNAEKEDAYAIVLKETNKVIGAISLMKDSSRWTVPSTETREMGYVLSEVYWGKGIMAEAGKLLLDYGFNTLNLNHISISHYSFNNQSKRVIEKLGFSYTGYLAFSTKAIFDGKIYDSCFYSMTKNDYEKK